jgi:hypothetical protein
VCQETQTPKCAGAFQKKGNTEETGPLVNEVSMVLTDGMKSSTAFQKTILTRLKTSLAEKTDPTKLQKTSPSRLTQVPEGIELCLIAQNNFRVTQKIPSGACEGIEKTRG